MGEATAGAVPTSRWCSRPPYPEQLELHRLPRDRPKRRCSETCRGREGPLCWMKSERSISQPQRPPYIRAPENNPSANQKGRRSQTPAARLAAKVPPGHNHRNSQSRTHPTPAPAPALHAQPTARLPSSGNAPSAIRCATHSAAFRALTNVSRFCLWRTLSSFSPSLRRLLGTACDQDHTRASARVPIVGCRHGGDDPLGGRRAGPELDRGRFIFRSRSMRPGMPC